MSLPLDTRHDDIRAYLAMMYGPGTGYCHIPYAAGPYRNAAGKITHHFWSERNGQRYAYLYPDDLHTIVATILELDRMGVDVYVCTNLMRSATSRSADNAVAELWCVHADADHSEVPLDVVAQLVWYAINSGTKGHVQVFAPLSEAVNAGQFAVLQNAFIKLLRADAKKAANDVLRPPCTRNCKPTVDGGEPNPVEWAVKYTGARWDPRKLAEFLQVDLDHPTSVTKAATNGQQRSSAQSAHSTWPHTRRCTRLCGWSPPPRLIAQWTPTAFCAPVMTPG